MKSSMATERKIKEARLRGDATMDERITTSEERVAALEMEAKERQSASNVSDSIDGLDERQSELLELIIDDFINNF